MIDSVGHIIRARVALVGAHRGEARQVQNAHTHDHHADNRRDAEDLLAFDANRGLGAGDGHCETQSPGPGPLVPTLSSSVAASAYSTCCAASSN